MATQPFSDLVLFPHCDLHMVLEGTPAPPTLTLRVAVRTGPAPERYSLKDATNPRFDFFAPNNPVGHRLDSTDLPTVVNGVVRATKAGVYLFQVRVDDKTPEGKSMSIVGRLQVHKKLEKWWFGNDSITTALDPNTAHAQPSIYARFTAGEKVDEVGDITGHNYVQLTSQDTNKVRVAAPEGRLYGLVATPDTAVKITGSFPATKDQSLDVYVVDYAQRRTVDVVHPNDLSNVDDMQNIIFLPEGFRKADQSRFESTVDHVVNEMFRTRRHEPYGMLQERFNVFRSNAASRQDTVTPGFRVTDNTTITNSTGFPIPYNGKIYGRDPENTYTMDQLVKRVGLRIRGDGDDNRRTFLTLWSSQSLDDFKPANVSEKLFTAWKAHSSLGILSARDTFFGFQLGRRWAERYCDTGEVEPPGNDRPDDAKLKPFVARVYSFFTTEATRMLTLDPRRHPPELYAGPSYENPNTSLMQYVRGLQHGTTDIGRVWVPEDNKFKRSRGLIAVIAFDQFSGGTNLNVLTITAQTTNGEKTIPYEYSTDPNKDPDPAVMRRDTTHVTFPIDITRVANVVAHEFGHSFNLGDEYEEAGKTNDDPEAKISADFPSDNLTRLGAIHTGPSPNSRVFDPRKIKWLGLPRIAHSARLVKASEEVPGVGIKVFIDPGSIPGWVVLQSAGVHVNLRKFAPTDRGVQLPLKLEDNTEYAPDLSIVDFNWGGGTLTLKGTKLPPPAKYPDFGAGSLLFVPVKQNNQPVSVVRAEVLAFLLAKIKPLNSDRDNKFAKSGPDTPLPIPNLRSRLQRGLIGLYEGANYYPGGNYRPAGACKMRDQNAEGESGEFCHVCKWLIVNRIDPSWHAWLELSHYPGGQP